MGTPLVVAPWSQAAFPPIATALVVIAAGTAVALALVTRAGRGGAPGPVLWARWRTWIVLATAFVLCVFSGPLPLAVLLFLLAAQGLREWGTLLDLPPRHRSALLVLAGVAMALAMDGPGALLGALPLLLLAGMLQPVLGADVRRGIHDLAAAVLGFGYLPFLLAFGVLLAGGREDGPALLFATGAAAAASDIGAYIAGKTVGRHRLAPALSPNKTVEGLLGNLLGTGMVVALLAPWLGSGPLLLVALAAGVAVAAVLGDLFTSALKREVGVKDAGTILPGFGGVLDRIDSLIVAVPVVYYLTGVTS
ncbi:MAG: phosphatidate cytidylyltransferase [Chloroflexota bacterium]